MERFRVAYWENGVVASAIRSMTQSHMGVTVTAVKRPAAMVAAAKREKVQLCILGSDPECIEAASQLKGFPLGHRPKVLILIDPAHHALLKQLMGIPIDEWLFLPCTSRQIVTTILSVLGRKDRLPLTAPIRVQLATQRKATAWAINIDAKGLLLGTDMPIAADADHKFCLHLSSGKLWLAGRVVRHEELQSGHRYGIRFLKVSPEAQLQLTTFDAMLFSYWGEVCSVELRYQITGDVDLTGVAAHMRETMVFDLSAVTRINSMGVSRWLEMIKLFEGTNSKIHYVRCTWPFVYLATLIPSFLGPGKVASAFLPYSCSECSLEQEMLVDLNREFAPDEFPVRFCHSCTGNLVPEAKASEIAKLARGTS